MPLNRLRRTRSVVSRLLIFVGLTIAFFALAAYANSPQAVAQTPGPAVVGDPTRRAEAGAVTVEVTPLNLADVGATTLDFQVSLNTHSVDLGVDLAKLAVLKANGVETAAVAWQAPPGGGHHVQGTLRFPRATADGQPLLAGAASFTIVIRDLGGVPERVFLWKLEQAGAAPHAHGDSAMAETPSLTRTLPMTQGMGAGSVVTRALPMDHSMDMAAGSAVTGTVPMGQGAGMMGMMGDMQRMMDRMHDMPPAEHQKMMADMMKGMQSMMGRMGSMARADQAQMMPQMMNMMGQMLEMMKEMPAQAQSQMMPQMMDMMVRMMAMMSGVAQAPTLHADMSVGGDSAADAHDMTDMGGHDHGAAISSAGVPEATATVGGQPLAFKVEDGVKVFELAARPVRWQILKDVVVTAWTYNGTVPGPMIRVTEGDRVRIVFKNELPEATSIHWHGIPVPNAMDGMTAIAPGESFAYEFTAPPAGTFMYHSHIAADKQVMIGLYAPFIVDPKAPSAEAPAVDVTWMLSEWRVGPDGQTYPAMPMMGAEPNYFTINGKSFPETATIEVKKGQRVRIRIANIGQFTHPMHLHGMNFTIVAYDGVPLPPGQRLVRNTVPVNPGEVVDIEFTADNVGTWMFHCHVLHHATNDGMEPGGLIALVRVTE